MHITEGIYEVYLNGIKIQKEIKSPELPTRRNNRVVEEEAKANTKQLEIPKMVSSGMDSTMCKYCNSHNFVGQLKCGSCGGEIR